MKLVHGEKKSPKAKPSKCHVHTVQFYCVRFSVGGQAPMQLFGRECFCFLVFSGNLKLYLLSSFASNKRKQSQRSQCTKAAGLYTQLMLKRNEEQKEEHGVDQRMSKAGG